MTRLFFYGTLMQGDSRGHVLAGLGRWVDEASISGDLYDVGYFPALVPTDSERRVRGEVWEILPGHEARALEVLDGIEGYDADRPATSLYLRRPVNARLASGEEVLVETYEWNRGTDGMPRIVGGSWKDYRSGERLPIGAA